MAAVTLQPPVPAGSHMPASQSSGLTTTTSLPVDHHASEQDFKTIDGLIKTRSSGTLANESIVAYPSSGTDYTYYTPRQVGSCGIFFEMHQPIIADSVIVECFC